MVWGEDALSMETIDDIIESLITAGRKNIEECDVDWTTEDVGRYQLELANRIKNAITPQFNKSI
jgi:hypothetical protein